MAFPAPHPGLVISYAYLWQEENRRGQEEGVKARPCAIILRRQVLEDNTIVVVLPVTHTPPINAADALQLPDALKAHLGLDNDRSWIVLSELNEFLWPGPDMRSIPGDSKRYDYGVLPPKFFRQLQEAFFARYQRLGLAVVRRTT